MKRHAFTRPAAEEYAAAAIYYAKLDPELGRRFYDEIELLILSIRQHPRRYRLFDGAIRRHFSRLFPYAVLYLDQSDRILIVAVMDMRRAPGYWKSRL